MRLSSRALGWTIALGVVGCGGAAPVSEQPVVDEVKRGAHAPGVVAEVTSGVQAPVVVAEVKRGLQAPVVAEVKRGVQAPVVAEVKSGVQAPMVAEVTSGVQAPGVVAEVKSGVQAPVAADAKPAVALVPASRVIEPTPALEAAGDVATLLGGGDASVVEIVERHAVGRDELVLLRWFGARAWRAQERAAGRLMAAEEAVQRKVDDCEAAPGEHSVCLAGAIEDPFVMWSALGTEVFAWEVARVREGREVVARVRLFEATRAVADVPHKFKVYDIDGDARSELTVIVPVELPQHEQAMQQVRGEVGFILEAADLREQFAATRSHVDRAEDVGGSETETETVWLARDVNADGHADLQVRETSSERQFGFDDEPGAGGPRRATRSTVCLYEPTADEWRCPEQLGRQLLPTR